MILTEYDGEEESDGQAGQLHQSLLTHCPAVLGCQARKDLVQFAAVSLLAGQQHHHDGEEAGEDARYSVKVVDPACVVYAESEE